MSLSLSLPSRVSIRISSLFPSPCYLHTRYIVFRISEPHRMLTANGVRRGLKIINANYTRATARHATGYGVTRDESRRARSSCKSSLFRVDLSLDYRPIQLIRRTIDYHYLLPRESESEAISFCVFPDLRPVPSRPVSFACSELYT